MRAIEIVVISAFVILLAFAILLISQFYICDGQYCRAFSQAKQRAPHGTKEYAAAVLGSLCADGLWPISYIGSAIITPLALWFIGVPITVLNFAILFFVSFAISHFMICFLVHHHVQFITNYITEYIRNDGIVAAPSCAP